MKYITAVAIVVTAVLGCSYVGDSKAETCADVWASNPQSKSEGFIRVSKQNPDITNAVKNQSIDMCESATRFSAEGGDLNTIISVVNRSMEGKDIPEEGRLSMVYMAVGGWKIGAEKR